MRVCLTVSIVLAMSPLVAFGQAKSPAAPAKYHVDLRYKIATEINQRVRDYRELTAALTKLGFIPVEREDADLDQFDPTAERLSGTIPSAEAKKLLEISAIKTSILRDAESKLPDDAKAPVHIRVTIASGLSLPEQHVFHDQVAAQLSRLGFVEFTGYDHKQFSLIRGTIPAGKVPDLLGDLRDQPSGWFFSEIPRDLLNLPLRDILPVRQVEILKDVDLGPTAALSAPLPAAIASPKYSLDLQAYLSNPATGNQLLRVEAITSEPLPEGARNLRELLRLRVPTAVMEAVYGNFVIVRVMNANDLVKVAEIPIIRSIRLPRLAAFQPGKPIPALEPILKSTGVGSLHAAGYRGSGSRIVILATDFIGERPTGSRLIDLTAELSPTIEPAPNGTSTSGSETARAARMAAPDAELILVRVDPVAVHQLLSIAKAVLGDSTISAAVVTRGDELIAEAERLNIRRDLVQEEYRRAFSDLSDDEKPTKRRTEAAAAFKALETDEKVFKAKYDRLKSLRQNLESLRGASVIVNTLVWEDGYAHDGLSEISQLLEKRLTPIPTRSGLQAQKLPRLPVWIQSGSTATGSVWSGPFLDTDQNGVMEFDRRIPVGNWTNELNFLTVLAEDGTTNDTLPTGAKIRVSIQWREPRDPDTELSGLPSFPLNLKLMRQIDPSGTTTASDDLAVVATSIGNAIRIQRTLTSAVYEQTLEITIPSAGRYALRVEGQLAQLTLAATNRSQFELRPRIYVRFTDANSTTNSKGRLALATYAPAASGVAIPGDARVAITVGVASGMTGSGPGILLGRKPDLFVPGLDSPSGATGVVAGAAAVLIESGIQSDALLRFLTPKPGETLKLPMEWIQSLPGKNVTQR